MNYLIFAGQNWNAIGGWNDFAASAVDLENAQRVANELLRGGDDWVHVVEVRRLTLVQYWICDPRDGINKLIEGELWDQKITPTTN